MNSIRWPKNVALIAVGTGWLVLAGENLPCQAQVLRSSLPIHLDDRDDTGRIPQPALNPAEVAQASAVETNQTAPPPLPTPAKMLHSTATLKA